MLKNINTDLKTNPTILNIYSQTAAAIKERPLILLPFVIFTALELIVLMLLFLAPRVPLIEFFGPPIRVFWGERFLHYPINFLLLPKLLSFSKMFLAVFIGYLLTGMAVLIIARVKNAFLSALKRYAALFIIGFIVTLLFYFGTKFYTRSITAYFVSGHTRFLFLGPRIWFGPILLATNFLYAILMQALFVYSIPFLLIGKETLFKSLIKAFVFFKNYFRKTIIFVGLPLLLYLPVVILQMNSFAIVNNIFPEMILLISGFGIMLSSLVIDPIITVSTTLFFLRQKEA